MSNKINAWPIGHSALEVLKKNPDPLFDDIKNGINIKKLKNYDNSSINNNSERRLSWFKQEYINSKKQDAIALSKRDMMMPTPRRPVENGFKVGCFEESKTVFRHPGKRLFGTVLLIPIRSNWEMVCGGMLSASKVKIPSRNFS